MSFFQSRDRGWVLGLFALALVVRVIGLDYGLPHLYHQDEPILMNHAMALGVSGPHPQFLVIPSFTIYFLFAIQAALFAAGKVMGWWNGAGEFGISFLANPGLSYWLGRFFLGALPGSLAAVAVFGLARRLGLGGFGSGFAGIAMALAPFCIQHSHYGYTDTLLTLGFVLISFWFADPVRFGGLGWAAFGWALSVKYTAMYIGPVLVAHGFCFAGRLADRGGYWRAMLLGWVSAGAVFFVFSPFTIIDAAGFLRQITHQAKAESGVGLWHHLNYSLREGVGEPLLILAGIGVASLLWVRRSPAWGWMAALFGVFYSVNSCFGQHFARYILPAVPWVILFAAKGVDLLAQSRVGFFRAAGLGLVVAVLLPYGYLDFKILDLLTQKDTRTLAREWVLERIPSGESIAMDHRFFNPRLYPDQEAVRAKLREAARRGLSAAKIRRAEMELQTNRPESKYRIWILNSHTAESAGDFLFHGPFLNPDNESLNGEGVRWVITNDADADRETRRWEEGWKRGRAPESIFSPYKAGFRVAPDSWSSTGMPHRRSEIIARERLGPVIEVWRWHD